MNTKVLGMTAIVLALAPAFALAQGGATGLATGEHGEYGAYITDAKGRALYMFEIDQQGGEGSGEALSECYDDCAVAWPPLLTTGEVEVSGNADANLVGAFQREDGTIQVTYSGWPLYYFERDSGPGDVEGHDVDGFGGEWYLLTPSGDEAPH